MSKTDDITRLKHIRDAAQKAINFVKDKERDNLDNDEMLYLALVRLIEIIGEAANNISEFYQQKYSDIPWRKIIGMRNRIVHAYFDVDLDIVWQVVKYDLSPLLKEINKAIKELT